MQPRRPKQKFQGPNVTKRVQGSRRAPRALVRSAATASRLVSICLMFVFVPRTGDAAQVPHDISGRHSTDGVELVPGDGD